MKVPVCQKPLECAQVVDQQIEINDLRSKQYLYLIRENLATHGLEAQWGSGLTDDMIEQPDEKGTIRNFIVMDIRNLMIDAFNPLSTYVKLVDRAIAHSRHGKLVICCSAGVSRSNSIAIGVLVMEYGMSFEDALGLVLERVPIANPLPCHLIQIRKLSACRILKSRWIL